MKLDTRLGRAALRAALFYVLSAAALVLPTGLDAPAVAGSAIGATERLTVITAGGRKSFEIEVADEPSEQAMGLMYRTSLAPGHGMLFVHEPPREVQMWMRNTYIPLDMLFIRSDGTVHRIAAMTEPMSDRRIPSRGEVAGVLEIGGGEAARLGIKPGDKVLHRHFGAGR